MLSPSPPVGMGAELSAGREGEAMGTAISNEKGNGHADDDE
jgi:hypothetical protein